MKILEIKTEKRRIGNIGENEAKKFLRRSGYKILDMNYVAADHEIDIIAEDKEVLAFIEVKTRSKGNENPSEPRPSSAVTKEKMRSIISAAKCYMAIHKTEKHIRLDVIEVLLSFDEKGKHTAEIKHLKDAFNMNKAYNRQ